jgi:tripartite-type tricarboxylate transporter receptor subunit TctC
MNTRLIGLLAGALLALPAAAQDYPKGPVRLIVPYPAGGTTDIYSRVLAAGMQQRFGQPFVVENVPGAATALGAERVARAAPDGHTLIMVTVTTMAMNPLTLKDLRYKPSDLAPVALTLRQPFVLVASLQFPPNNVKELIAYAKANPGKINWATQGIAGSSHLVGELLQSLAGIQLFAVHYKGSAPANTDLFAGRAELHFDGSGTSFANIAGKRVKPIAHTGDKRLPGAPDVPTFVESGLPGMQVWSWYGIAATAGTPQPVVNRLNAEMNAFMKTKEVQERMVRDGSEAGEMTPEQFGKMIADETELWRKVLAPLNLKLD